MLELYFLSFFFNACINGIIGNRADATAVSITRNIAKQFQASKIINHDMQKALDRSFQLSLKSICDDCLNVGKREFACQRGNSQLRNSLTWLENKKSSVEKELSDVEKKEYEEPTDELLEEIKLLLVQGDPTSEMFRKVRTELIGKAIEEDNAPECYKERVEKTILSQMCYNFAHEIKTNQAISSILETQLLIKMGIKIDAMLDFVPIMVQNLTLIPAMSQQLDHLFNMAQESKDKIRDFITLDKYLLSSNQRYWPKLKDIEDGKLYWPERCLEEIEKKIHENGHCMLTGASGSGKTALAIAFGLWWRDPTKRNHSEATVFYLDAETKKGGEDWYHEVLTHGYQNEIFIIDNCHLNTEDVNLFCSQLEWERPENVFFLLISAPRISESLWGDKSEYYFDYIQQEAILPLDPESLYRNIFQTYSNVYMRTDPHRFIPIENDFSDSDRAAKLHLLCSKNLVVVRSILEEWGKRGGRLSDVTEEIVLDSLADRYLSSYVKKVALVPLCNLGQFEIPAHEIFIDQNFMQESIKALINENMIFPEDDKLFGRCYKVSFHPQVAALIFRAYIYRNIGSTFEISIDDEIFKYLKNYLSPSSKNSIPENFSLVYSRLKQTGALDLQRRLLSDAELQNYAFQKFTRPLNEVSQYLSFLYIINPDKAKNLLQNFINQKTVEKLQVEVSKLKAVQFFYAVSSLTKIDLDTSAHIFGRLPFDFIADRIIFSSLSNIVNWISPSSSSAAAKLNYSVAWRRKIARMLDLNILMEKALKATPLNLVWFLRSFIAIDREQAKLFIYTIPPEILGKKFSGQPISIIESLFGNLYGIECDSTYFKHVVHSFDQPALFNQMKDARLQTLFWILRSINYVEPEFIKSFLTYITPAGLVEKIRRDGDSARYITNFICICDRQFKRKFLQHVNNEEIVTIIEQSKLGDIGTLLENYPQIFELPYSTFAIQKLPDLLAKEKINEINKFVKRIQRIPSKGQRLAVQVLDLLLKSDFADSIINSDAEQLALLLENSFTVDATYPNKILIALAPSGAVKKALLHSDIRGFQLLIHNLSKMLPESKMAPELLLIINQSLQTLDLSDQIKKADIKDLGYFLWNIQANLGAELAQKYCRTVDANIQSKQIVKSTLFELGGFLWNLVHISDLKELRVLSIPLFKEKLENSWQDDPCQCIRILGILVTVSPEAIKSINFSALDIESISDILIMWLKQQLNPKDPHPYTFALTIKGLQVLDEKRTTEIIQNIFCNKDTLDKYQKLFRNTTSNDDITLRSLNLLESVDKFVDSVPKSSDF